MSESYITIATDDISCLGCLVLCNSLKKTGTDKLISVLVNPIVSCHLKSVLRKSFDKVYFINDLFVISDGQNRFDVHGDYEKLKCWLLTDFTKCVFLESDVLVVENIDDLFNRAELSAASDPRWPDCFDAGVFVFQPCLKTYKQLLDYSITNRTPDNSFQCLLNMFFCDWNINTMDRKISFVYNCQMNSTFYTHVAALVHFGHSIKAARMGHSIFNLMEPNPSLSGPNYENWSRLWSLWWKIFNEMVKPAVDNNETLKFKRLGCDYGKKTECSTREIGSLGKKPECSISEPALQNQELEFSVPTVVFSRHPSGCLSQPSGCPNEPPACVESNCPSQDFTVHFEQIASNSDLTMQRISQEEPCQTSRDTFVVSPVAASSVDIPEKEVINEEQDKTHRLKWERGEIDYMGTDSFDKILAKLNSSLVSPNNDDETVNTEE